MKHSAVFAVVTCLALGLTMAACQAEPKVVVTTAQGREVSFNVEVAETPAKRELGLQYRHDLSADHGMIFVFPREAEQTFWMKNTPIPLDMIFINGARRIVGIVENAIPFSLDPRSVSGPSQFVLEVNGGICRRYGIGAGDSVRLLGISAAAARE